MFNYKYEQLKKEYETLSIEFENYKKTIHQQTSELPMVVDFEHMKVVSIERVIQNNIAVTVLGYISPICTELQEWVLFCSDSNHIMLVDQFKKYLKS